MPRSARWFSLGIGLWALLGGWLWAAGAPGPRGVHSAHEAPAAESVEAEHRPHHGGYFGDADDVFHYEVLLEDAKRLALYVNDDRNRPLDVRALQGRWTLEPDGPSPVTGTFSPSEDGRHFTAHLPPTDADPVHVSVGVLKGERWADMEFFLPARSAGSPE